MGITNALVLFIGTMTYGQTTAITQIKGDLYRFQFNAHYAVFLVTGDGIVMTDPISMEASTWLKKELKSRFNKPVTHLIYSHDHADHISGGQVFGDQVEVIAHELTKKAIQRENRNVPLPSITFSDHYTLKTGDKTVELFYPGKSHGDNCIAMLFPEERTVFVVDFITVDRLPYRDLSDGHMPQWIQALEKVEQLDFDIVAPGHGELGTKEDVAEHRRYFEALRKAVAKAIDQGQSLEEMKQSIKLPEFSHFGNYQEWLPLNIEGMYNMLKKA